MKRIENIDKHVDLLKIQLATLSLNMAALQSQVKEIENRLDLEKYKTTVPIHLNDKTSVASNLSVDDNEDEDSEEGYDTDDTPLQTHRVKTKLPHIRHAREQFVYVNDYAKTNGYESGYES